MVKTNTKVRYSVKYTNGNIEHKIFTLDQVEKEGLSKLFDTTNCEIIGRSLSTNLININSEEIFENDIVKQPNGDVGSVSFDDGSFWVYHFDEPCKQNISDFSKFDIDLDGYVCKLKVIGKIALISR